MSKSRSIRFPGSIDKKTDHGYSADFHMGAKVSEPGLACLSSWNRAVHDSGEKYRVHLSGDYWECQKVGLDKCYVQGFGLGGVSCKAQGLWLMSSPITCEPRWASTMDSRPTPAPSTRVEPDAML